MTALLYYSSECWTSHSHPLKQLERFHQNCLRKILKIKWQSLTPDTIVLRKANYFSVKSPLMKNQLRWAGHAVCINDNRIPKQCFYSKLVWEKRPRRKAKKRFKDVIKNSLKSFMMPVDWEELARNRAERRKSVNKGTEIFEKERIEHAELKRT